MADIRIAFEKIVVPFEGLYSNDKDDAGGETCLGIARRSNPEWGGWPLIGAYKNKPGFPANLKEAHAILDSLAMTLYKKKYWDVLRLDEVKNTAIAIELFDISINQGPGVAATFLQRVLNVFNRNEKDYADLIVDGMVGNRTITVLNMHRHPQRILLALNCLQGARYISICENNKTQEKFMNGWIERTRMIA
jgi:lysozyme family protein